MFHVKQSAMEHQIAESGLQPTQEQLERLEQAAAWLARVAEASGLSAYESPKEAWQRGMAPALAYFSLSEAPRNGTLVDLGAGSGALGATIAILERNLRVDLVDRAEKAYTACELLVARLELRNLRARRLDAAEARGEGYNAAVFRAVAAGEQALALATRMVRPTGFIGAYHRRGDRAFTDDVELQGLTVLRTVGTTVPGLALTGYRT
ncbi:MAG: RsmG family class I SAM-dependent methyltransferase [Armatimonadota bacterium]|nr:RsmG family class I SAM-dependent methyltransferase [Armatimonadota bacterium]